jgi:dTDP-4-dehydrorhamnose reductase
MKDTKVLIIGNNGQLGHDCSLVLSNSFQVIPIGSNEVDITDLRSIIDHVLNIKPQFILNCAAYTKVDECENNKNRAWNVNALGPLNLALCAKNFGAKLIHISTDYVFDGFKKLPEKYSENDQTNPLSYYGKSKLEGEKMLRGITQNHIILRTSWLYGINGGNFLKTIMSLAISNPDNQLKIVNDQFGSPTSSKNLALQIKALIDTNSCGTYHASSENYCSWYDFAKLFFDLMEIPNRITPCSTEEYPTLAKRPKNSILENTRLKRERINLMSNWQEVLKDFVFNNRAKLLQEVSEKKEVKS